MQWRIVGGLALALAAAVAGGARIKQHAAVAGLSPPGQLIDVGGRRMHLRCEGTGSPTVLLESGLGDGWLVWGWVQPRIAARTRVCSYDRAGYGFSDRGVPPRTSDRIAEDLGRLLNASGVLAPYVLVGWSAGGLHVRAFQAKNPDKVVGLVLVEAAHEAQWQRLDSAFTRPTRAMHARFRMAGRLAGLGLGWLPGSWWGSPLAPETDGSVGLWTPAPTELQPLGRILGREPRWPHTLADEARDFDLSAVFVANTRTRLAIPLVVVEAGLRPEGEAFTRGWQALQRDLLTLSSVAEHILVPTSDHDHMGSSGADSVVAAIDRMLDRVSGLGDGRSLTKK